MKEFRSLYKAKGAYHRSASGFDKWFLDDNYRAIATHCGAGRILDLGCGEGCLASYVDAKGMVGVDYSDIALGFCRESTGDAYAELHEADLAQIGGLGLKPASFDAAVCSLTLMYLKGSALTAALDAVHEVLVPGGRFVITYPTVSERRSPNPDAAELTPDALQAALVGAGFLVDLVEPFCPLVPKEVVQASHDPASQAKAAYEAAKVGLTMADSYHYVVVCRRPA